MKNDVELDPRSVDELLEIYSTRKKQKREDEEKFDRENKELKDRLSKELLQKQVLRGEVEKTKLEDLAKPKDPLKVGKAIMHLTKMFPQDKILKKLLVREFHERKLAKYPEEYDIYDSDEETDIKARDLLKEPYKSMMEDHRKVLFMADLIKPLKNREKEITAPFQKHLSDYYLDMHKSLEQQQNRKKNEQQEEKLLERLIAGKVKEFAELRQKRLETKIPSLRQYLTACYKEMKAQYPGSTERRFPHITYGYSKRLKGSTVRYTVSSNSQHRKLVSIRIQKVLLLPTESD